MRQASGAYVTLRPVRQNRPLVLPSVSGKAGKARGNRNLRGGFRDVLPSDFWIEHSLQPADAD